MPMPKAGDLSVVTNWSKTPLCVIETQRVDVVAYDEVSEEFAATEGEGDGSLQYWREAHWAYFGRECERIGRSREPKMPVVCERFEVVFGARDTIRLSPYSAQWAQVFEAERHILRGALPAFRIEHVGSTAIPGAVAKPIVDILVGGPSLVAIEDRIPALEAIGYRYVPAYEADLPQRRYFVKPGDRPHRFHLHAVETGSAFWVEHLLFRDTLRADSRLLAQYCALKVELAARFGDDREGYTDAKRPFIRLAIEQARSRAT